MGRLGQIGRGSLAGGALATVNDTEIYSPSIGRNASIEKILVANTGSTLISLRLGIAPTGTTTLTDAQWFVFGRTLEPTDTLPIEDISLKGGEALFANGQGANVHLFGVEERISGA